MSATGVFGPAPPGVDLSANQNGMMVGGVATLIVLGTLAVALRLYTRTMTRESRFAVDDYLILAAYVSQSSSSRRGLKML